MHTALIKGEGQSGGLVYHYRSGRVVGLASAIWNPKERVNEGQAVRFEALFSKWTALHDINRVVAGEWDRRLQRLNRGQAMVVETPKPKPGKSGWKAAALVVLLASLVGGDAYQAQWFEASASKPAVCPTPNAPGTANYAAQCPTVSDLYVVRTRPQVLMAGFDPILLDTGDDEFKIMAIVREGVTPIRHVKVSENTGSMATNMDLEGQLPNGDKVYSLTFVGTRFLPSMNDMLSNSFGSKPGEFNITVVDEASMTHSFPHLEFGNHQDVARGTPLTTVRTYTKAGIKRSRPQTLMAGFDPAIIDVLDTYFKVKAIVRRGSFEIRSVTLKTNDNFFAVKMNKETDLPNGDEMYSTDYSFARGAFPTGAFGQFIVETIDEGSQSHAFPILNVCDCPAL